jgi:hypothetical protein
MSIVAGKIADRCCGSTEVLRPEFGQNVPYEEGGYVIPRYCRVD